MTPMLHRAVLFHVHKQMRLALLTLLCIVSAATSIRKLFPPWSRPSFPDTVMLCVVPWIWKSNFTLVLWSFLLAHSLNTHPPPDPPQTLLSCSEPSLGMRNRNGPPMLPFLFFICSFAFLCTVFFRLTLQHFQDFHHLFFFGHIFFLFVCFPVRSQFA